MEPLARARRLSGAPPGERLDFAMVAAVAGLVLGAVVSLAVPGVHVRVVAPTLALVLETVAALVTLSVAVLAWVRYRGRGDPVALFQAAAFVVLALADSLGLGLQTIGLDAQAGMALSAPGQAPLYVHALARIVAAVLLVIGGRDSLRHLRPRLPRLVLVGPAIAMLLAFALVEVSCGVVAPARVDSVRGPGAALVPSPDGGLPSTTVLGAAVELVVAALFLGAAALSRRLYRRDGSIGDAYLAVGLVFAAFAQAATAVYPGSYAGLVTSSDLLRLAFDGILLLGIQAEAVAGLARLREANADLARLRDAEVERAALAERARISRELHDGLAQNLWMAKLKAGRLAALPDLGPEAIALADDLTVAIDAGLAEARDAVAAMRLGADPVARCRSFCRVRPSTSVTDSTCASSSSASRSLPTLAPRAQAEALRITQEALSNVRRHADATVVRVRVATAGRPAGRRSCRQRLWLRSGRRRRRRVRPRQHARAGRDDRWRLADRVSAPGWDPGQPPRAAPDGGHPCRSRLRRDGARSTRSPPRHAGRRPSAAAVGGAPGARRARYRGGGRGGDGGGGADAAPAVRPDVLLLDIGLPGMDGVSLVRELAPRLPETRIVMLTVSSADQDLLEPCAYGAVGYLTKDLSPEALLRAVRSAYDGELAMTRRMAARLVARLEETDATDGTPRSGSRHADRPRVGGAALPRRRPNRPRDRATR